MLPSRWILSPFGQPSYWVTRSQSPFGPIRKILPKGMSTHHRLPLRSNEGPSRKLSTGASWRLGSDHAVRRFLRKLAGSEVQRRAGTFFIAWKGFSIGMRRRIGVFTTPYKEDP